MAESAAGPEPIPIRFIGLDVHRKYAVATAVDEHQQIVVSPRRIPMSDLRKWAGKALWPTDVVVLEAMFNTWNVYEQLVPLVAAVLVADPAKVARRKDPGVKTDAADALFLARLSASSMLPEVWVPPVAVRELRSLVNHRQRLITQRTRSYNRLQAVLLRHGLEAPEGELFGPAKRAWWDSLSLSQTQRLHVQYNLATVDFVNSYLSAAEAELYRLSQQEPWAEQVGFLVQLPGIQVLTAMVLLSAIGDISRFPTAGKLVGYAGLGASVHDSGQTHRTGGITKRGRRELRGALTEAAWNAVQNHPFWKAEFNRFVEGKHLHPNAAITAVARKMLVVLWHVLSKREADREAIPAKVARKFLLWSYKVGRKQRAVAGSCATFVRTELNRVGIQPPSAISSGNRTLNLTATAAGPGRPPAAVVRPSASAKQELDTSASATPAGG